MGPARQKLNVLGNSQEPYPLKHALINNFFIVKDIHSNLLGLPAILVLNLIVRVAEVSEDYSSVIQKYSSVIQKYSSVIQKYGSVIQKKYHKVFWVWVPCKESTLLNYRLMPNHMLYVLHVMFLYSYARRFTQNQLK